MARFGKAKYEEYKGQSEAELATRISLMHAWSSGLNALIVVLGLLLSVYAAWFTVIFNNWDGSGAAEASANSLMYLVLLLAAVIFLVSATRACMGYYIKLSELAREAKNTNQV
ncbi:hypothetical protein [Rothia halotolerans]|uniref:hypothetical protein n=1 Tax=Rothia halotolerans TaxID=405770 RepID=UPI00101D3B12|nr:hypothetical protein [Rothia halotolerans]